MKTIPLTKGQVAIVDDEDYEWLMQWKWHCKIAKRVSYAARNEPHKGKLITLRMHQQIMGEPPAPDLEVDHINRSGIDNRRCNLRWATKSQNAMNRRMKSDNNSGVKGVSWNAQCKRWHAEIQVHGWRVYLGRFDTLDDAAKAYAEASNKYHGEFGNA